jgi:hypothetical protein
MSSHASHPSLPGYDPFQIWCDGCQECELRSRALPMSMMELDAQRYREAWMRAFWWQHDDDTSLHLSQAEMPLLKTLWAMQVALERFFGWPVGSMPQNPTPGRARVLAVPQVFTPVTTGQELDQAVDRYVDTVNEALAALPDLPPELLAEAEHRHDLGSPDCPWPHGPHSPTCAVFDTSEGV